MSRRNLKLAEDHGFRSKSLLVVESKIAKIHGFPHWVGNHAIFCGVGLGVVVICLLFLIGVGAVLYCRYYRRSRRVKERRTQLTELDGLSHGPQKFSYKELNDATHSFSPKEELGQGGFGSVFKGVLPNTGTGVAMVAVKRICKKSKQGPKEFLAEVKSIGRMRHQNLVPLLGWCHEQSKGELLLVYEYMPNGSLDNLLFPTTTKGKCEANVLPWQRRMNILIGVATGMHFLHEGYEQCVVHRDVKASNVMLDADFNARLGDFGFARLYDHSQEPKYTSHIAGTIGYMAPELTQDGKTTVKTDVYSFGALALELATGRAVADRPPSGKTLVDWVWELFASNNLLAAKDSSLKRDVDCSDEELKLVVQIALLCSHPDPEARPTMQQTLSYIRREAPFPSHMLPLDKPLPMFAVSLRRSDIVSMLASSGSDIWSAYLINEGHMVDIISNSFADSEKMARI